MIMFYVLLLLSNCIGAAVNYGKDDTASQVVLGLNIGAIILDTILLVGAL